MMNHTYFHRGFPVVVLLAMVLLCRIGDAYAGGSAGDTLRADSLNTFRNDSGNVKAHRKTTVKPTTDFDQRFSFIRNQSVNIWGQRGGVLLNEEWKVGVGVYYMNDTKMLSRQIVSAGGIPSHYLTQSLIFGTGYFEPFLLRKKYWELSVPIELGYGKASSKVYETADDVIIRTNSKVFLPTGAGLSLSLKLPSLTHFKPLGWVGINFLAGYRYCLLENIYKTDYDGAFWSVSGAVFLDKVFDDVRSWKRSRRKPAV
jgi:hypothetical protein